MVWNNFKLVSFSKWEKKKHNNWINAWDGASQSCHHEGDPEFVASVSLCGYKAVKWIKESRAFVDGIMWSGSCAVWSYGPICLHWQSYWGTNPVSRPAPVMQAALLLSLLCSALVCIICWFWGLLPSILRRTTEIVLLPYSSESCSFRLSHIISVISQRIERDRHYS